MEKKIAIVGAGISGLLACKHTMEKGFNPVVFEARSGIGGVWSTTIDSTKLQTPKEYYQFSDFSWPISVTETFPDHIQVMNYIESYAVHFDIFSRILFNTKVVTIEKSSASEEEMSSWEQWGGSGDAFSPEGKWIVTVQDLLHPLEPPKEYQVDFVILCIGKFSDLPNIPHFPEGKGAEVFRGKVIHSMDFASMTKTQALEFIKDKRVTVIGFQKSALDIASQVSTTNGSRHPCTLLFRRAHWSGSENLVRLTFKNLNRFSELMIHKPEEGFVFWLLAILLSPLRWIFAKLVEWYLKWTNPLKKFDMIPKHSFLKQIYSCMFTVLPDGFYERVEDGGLILKKSNRFQFCKTGLIIDSEVTPLDTDVVIFATGYKSDEKISNIFASNYLKKCIITGSSSAPFYRECIHPRIPNLGIIGYSESPATLYTTEVRSKWLAYFLAGKFKLPDIKEMEEDTKRWEMCMRKYSRENYKRACVSVMLQIYCNDQLCREIGCKHRRKKWCLPELFSPYRPLDYANV